MITDEGAQLLLVAVYEQARADLEELFGRVILYRRACERGQLGGYSARQGLPLEAEDERTAYDWYAGKANLPNGMREMLAAIGGFDRYCRRCAAGGGGKDGAA